ncbi:hypothetical protein HanXRQr2_Chr10g0453271 [Helianthus annuus]|uniref:Uncharacterized protein n=1 Tax=Helianthus annuus TaxID=4232 RepID=A0A9K3N503_HELAN|nr:hypothetical protein HanXRQr2_Chr10g0453271 [Helianthus annuus]
MHWFRTANLGKYCYQSATYNNISVSNSEVHYCICFKQRLSKVGCSNQRCSEISSDFCRNMERSSLFERVNYL